MAVAEQSDDVRNRAFATALVSDDRDKFFAEDDLLVVKPLAMPLLLIPVNAGDV